MINLLQLNNLLNNLKDFKYKSISYFIKICRLFSVFLFLNGKDEDILFNFFLFVRNLGKLHG